MFFLVSYFVFFVYFFTFLDIEDGAVSFVRVQRFWTINNGLRYHKYPKHRAMRLRNREGRKGGLNALHKIFDSTAISLSSCPFVQPRFVNASVPRAVFTSQQCVMFAYPIFPISSQLHLCISFFEIYAHLGWKQKFEKRISSATERYRGNPRIDTDRVEHTVVSPAGFSCIHSALWSLNVISVKGWEEGRRKIAGHDTNRLYMLIVLSHQWRNLHSPAILKQRLKRGDGTYGSYGTCTINTIFTFLYIYTKGIL